MKPILLALAVLSAVFCFSLRSAPQSAATPAARRASPVGEPIKPIPAEIKLDPRKVALGRKLFFDPLLSRDNTVSCSSCHSLEKGGTDHRARSLGINNAEGEINAPTVFNSGFNFRQFWDGRVSTLEEQVEGPIHAAAEMGSTWEEIVAKLRRSPEYAAMFQRIFPDGVQAAHIKSSIAEFERSLSTPNSRIDRYLQGEAGALTAEEAEGYRKFKSYGCSACHQGVNVGGNMFETLGAVNEYFAERGRITKADLGRFNVTGREEDRHVFKVPSLRNIALTPPYFHDGSAKTLEEAVAIMARYQLGRPLPDEDLALIVKFLRTLNGEYEGKPL